MIHARRVRDSEYVVDPEPNDSIFEDIKILADTPEEYWSRFGDDIWYLHPMAKKASFTKNLDFSSTSATYKLSLKRFAWCLINIQTPLESLSRQTSARRRLSAGSIYHYIHSAAHPFFVWLEKRGIRSLASVITSDLENYAKELDSKSVVRDTKNNRLFCITRLWLYAPYLPECDRLCCPPWETQGVEEFIGASAWSHENKTRPINPNTISPLLLWALRFINDFSEDVINARKLKEEMLVPRVTGQDSKKKMDAYFEELRRTGERLPTHMYQGKECIANV